MTERVVTASPDHNSRPLIQCATCGQWRRPIRATRTICAACYKQEASSPCGRCQHPSHHLDAETGLCPRCLRVVTRPVGPCTRCQNERPIFDAEQELCEQCLEAYRKRERRAARRLVECSVCGQRKRSALATHAICATCYSETHQRVTHHAQCSHCQQHRKLANVAHQLCRNCYTELRAPAQFQRYVADFVSPYPYNNELFALLTATIDPEQVKDFVVQQFRAFGRFLQTHPLPEPLTWEALEAVMPPPGAKQPTHDKHVRALLLQLGHQLAAQGKMEAHEVYLVRQTTQRLVDRVPSLFLPITQRYRAYLEARDYRPRSLQHKLTVLGDLWRWCTVEEIRSAASVGDEQVEQYLRDLTWAWRCTTCSTIGPYTIDTDQPPRQCEQCGTAHSFVKLARKQITINVYRRELDRFFDWAVRHRLVVANPVRHKGPRRYEPVRHYPVSVLQPLCQYMIAPDADPTEALVLYLVLFHGLSSWELSHAQMPQPQDADSNELLSLADAYAIIVPHQAVSPGKGLHRPSERLGFLPDAAPWLKRVLVRFEEQRRQQVTDQANRYLSVPSRRRRENAPAPQYPDAVIQRASERVLGMTCTLAVLRRTALVALADTSDGAILTQLGWTGHSAYRYVWDDRQIVVPAAVADEETHNHPSKGEFCISLASRARGP